MDFSIDIILVSNAKSFELEKLTFNAIQSSKPHPVTVIESNSKVNYAGAKTIHPSSPFNYNRYLNLGARHAKGDYIFFGNNDILFTAGWDKEIVNGMRAHNVKSASPYCPLTHKDQNIVEGSGVIYGLEIYKYFCGWAFIWERLLYDQVEKLDESFTFWCSDNVVVEQLKKLDEKHILVTSSIVHHVGGGSRTLIGIDDNLYNKYTKEELNKFNKLFNQNIHLKEEYYPKAKFLKGG